MELLAEGLVWLCLLVFRLAAIRAPSDRGVAVKSYPREKPRKPSANDVADAAVLAACQKAAVAALRPVLEANRDRFLRELQPHELQAVVVAVISEYIATRRLLELKADLDDPIADLFI